MRKSRTKKRTYKRKRSYKRTSKVSKKVRRYVRKEISRQVENKRSAFSATGVPIYTYITDAQVVTLLPFVSQGTGQGDRTGNSIKIKRASLRLHVYCRSDQPSSSVPKFVDIYIFKYRRTNNAPDAAAMARFLQLGNSATNYDGEPLDGLRPINDDLFKRCYHKRIKMVNSNDLTNQPGYGGINAYSTVISCTKWIKKIQKFDDNNAAPTNDNLFLAIGGIFTDLSNTVGTVGEYAFDYDYVYEDA